MKILFILKHRKNNNGYSGNLHSGLYNSARFISDILNFNHVETKIVQVNDNNCIDREVSIFKPNIVVIEALWVEPNKFHILTKLYPNIKWIIRNHSKLPFLANEGIAIDWFYKYSIIPNVYISCNNLETNNKMKKLIGKSIYLPNYYPIDGLYENNKKIKNEWFNVGCFGAIRPLKNHLIQSIAAIEFANKHNLKMRFHINATRIEGRGEPILKNIQKLFENNIHELVEHEWVDHNLFLNLVSTMDIGLQVSYSETFNIVSADFVSRNRPIVGSNEIKWLPFWCRANPNDVDDIICKMENSLFMDFLPFNYYFLKFAVKSSISHWFKLENFEYFTK